MFQESKFPDFDGGVMACELGTELRRDEQLNIRQCVLYSIRPEPSPVVHIIRGTQHIGLNI